MKKAKNQDAFKKRIDARINAQLDKAFMPSVHSTLSRDNALRIAKPIVKLWAKAYLDMKETADLYEQVLRDAGLLGDVKDETRPKEVPNGSK